MPLTVQHAQDKVHDLLLVLCVDERHTHAIFVEGALRSRCHGEERANPREAHLEIPHTVCHAQEKFGPMPRRPRLT